MRSLRRRNGRPVLRTTIDDPAGHGMREDGLAPRANKQYFDALRDWRERFDGPISIYSYYRRYAWDSLPVVLPWHMKREMDWYGTHPGVPGPDSTSTG